MISLLKKAIIDLPINMKGNSKHTSIDSSSPLVAQNKNIARCFADVNNQGKLTSVTKATMLVAKDSKNYPVKIVIFF